MVQLRQVARVKMRFSLKTEEKPKMEKIYIKLKKKLDPFLRTQQFSSQKGPYKAAEKP